MNLRMKYTQSMEAPINPEAVKMIVQRMDPDLVRYYVLKNDRKLFLDSEIDNNVLNIQRMIIRWNMEDTGKSIEERRPINLYVFSPGGDVDMM